MVVYPRGDRSRLAVAQVRDYEKSDWALASERTFEYESECCEYMVELATRHRLHYAGQQHYLD